MHIQCVNPKTKKKMSFEEEIVETLRPPTIAVHRLLHHRSAQRPTTRPACWRT